MGQTEYKAALSAFLRNKGVTRCPTACAAPTAGSVTDGDKAALRDHQAAREATRLEKAIARGFLPFRSHSDLQPV
jgi:hypothetical protein